MKKNRQIFSLAVSVFFALSVVGTLLSVGGGTAFASTRPSIHVVANITVPAKHVQGGKNASSTVNPNIGGGSCVHFDYLQIWYNNGNNETCYSGNGYTGANLRNVGKFVSGNNCGWFLMYSSHLLNGSEFITFDSGIAGIDNFSFIPNNLITQIDIQGQNCTGYHA